MTNGLSAREVATLVGVPESRVRYWAQIGLVGPTFRTGDDGKEGGRPSYGFVDLVAARAARELIERGIPARRVREALTTLRAQLPALDRPLLHLRVLSDGDRLVVAGDQPFEPLSGQRVMDFQLDDLSRQVAALAADGVPRPIAPDATVRSDAADATSGPDAAPPTSLDWFELGLGQAHLGDLDAAIEAYRAALTLDDALAPAHANLASLLLRRGDVDEATRHLDLALEHDPSSIEAQAYRAEICERRGEHAEALSRWAALLAAGAPDATAGVTRAHAALRRRRAL